jgi:hypothetical protein
VSASGSDPACRLCSSGMPGAPPLTSVVERLVTGIAMLALSFAQSRENHLTLRDEFFAPRDPFCIVHAAGRFVFLLPVGKLALDGAQSGSHSHNG